MRPLYTLGILAYTLGVRLAALCGHRQARLLAQGWRQWPEALRKLDKDRPVAWFHAASLGEFEQARPLLEAYRQRHPDRQVLLTFFSPSGYEVRHNYPQAEAVCYLPPDTPRNARRLVAAAHPSEAFFVKYEFWFNHLDALRRAGTKTYLFSAIFRPGQYFFRWYGGWFRRQLAICFAHLFVQNEESIRLLRANGIAQCSLAGDTRYDRVNQIVQTAPRNAIVEAFLGNEEQHVVVAGSTWPPDEQLLHRWLPLLPAQTRLVIAPHQIHEEHLRQVEALFPDSVRYSRCAAPGFAFHNQKVLIIDNIGMLSQLYRYARVAYIGGGFGVGIHNILEAVAYGAPVIFGPHYGKFQEAHDLIALGGAWSVGTESAPDCLIPLLDNDDRYRRAQDACNELMRRNLGSTQTILNAV